MGGMGGNIDDTVYSGKDATIQTGVKIGPSDWFDSDYAWLDAADTYAALVLGPSMDIDGIRTIEKNRSFERRIHSWTDDFAPHWKIKGINDAQGRWHDISVAMRVAALLTGLLRVPGVSWQVLRDIFGWELTSWLIELNRQSSVPLHVKIYGLRTGTCNVELCTLLLASVATIATLHHTNVGYLKQWLPEANVIMEGIEPLLGELTPFKTTKDYLELLRKRVNQPLTSKPSDIVVPLTVGAGSQSNAKLDVPLGGCVD